MRKTRSHLMAAGAALGVATLIVGCSTSPPTAADTNVSTVTTRSPALPTPFTITARYSAESLGLQDPSSLAIGPDGDLYVTDISQRVSVISPAGKVLRRWGKGGRGPGQFRFVSTDPNDPKDIGGDVTVASNGTVYVSDQGNARVQVFTAHGAFLRQLGSFSNGKGRFLAPGDLAVDSAENVYVTDGATLSKFDPSDKLVWQDAGNIWPNHGLVGGLHLNDIDAHGRLVIANDATSQVVYLDRSNGRKLDSFDSNGDTPDAACDTTVDAFGYTYVADCGEGAVRVFNREHQLVAQWPATPDPLRRAPRFGPNNEVFALGQDGSILGLHLTLPRG